MYGQNYLISASLVASAASLDLLRISAPGSACVILHDLAVETVGEVDASESLGFTIHRGSTDGSGGSSATVAPTNLGQSAYAGTAVMGNTSKSTLGTVLRKGGANVLNPGWYAQAGDEGKAVISPSQRLVVTLDTAPADPIQYNITANIEVIGG